jgi:hypothetical protein
MKQQINEILDFAKNKKPQDNSFLIYYSINEKNEIVIDKAEPSAIGKDMFFFFRDFANEFEPTNEDVMRALFKFLGI